MSCGVGHSCGLDLALLWLWYRLAATAPIGPLAWEPPYAIGAAQKMAKITKTKKFLVLEYSDNKEDLLLVIFFFTVLNSVQYHTPLLPAY